MLEHLAWRSMKSVISMQNQTETNLQHKYLPNANARSSTQADNKLVFMNPYGFTPSKLVSLKSIRPSLGLSFIANRLITQFHATRSLSGINSNIHQALSVWATEFWTITFVKYSQRNLDILRIWIFWIWYWHKLVLCLCNYENVMSVFSMSFSAQNLKFGLLVC